MSQPAYRIKLHRRAEHELERLDDEVVDQLTDRVVRASELRNPLDARHAKPLNSYDLFAIRGEGVRAICALEKPELLVVLVGKRRTVYDRLDVAERRAEEGCRR